MRTHFKPAAVLLAISSFGCGPETPREAAIEELISATNQIADIMEKIEDVPSAQAARPKLEDAVARFKAAERRGGLLRGPSAQESERLKEKYGEKSKLASTRLNEAGYRFTLPEMAQATAEIASILAQLK
ncbi:MAG: hypothetical protein NTY19_27405 [Planctomycetota bacterium]|nr:hypothetical protein [Planctomycetota bacterium]